MIIHSKKYTVLLISMSVLTYWFIQTTSPTHAATIPCTVLSINLYQGATDVTMGGQIRLLQNFLVSAGYLTAKPNGVFGPATYAAVKQYQSTHTIQTTGVTGPLTRSAIQKESCSITTTPPATTASVPPTVPATTTVPHIIVTNPQRGVDFTLGESYLISWTGPSDAMGYSILLEDQNGAGKGYIALGAFPEKQYTWKAGEILSSNNQTIALGTYRIRVQHQVKGPMPYDETSGVFHIVYPPLTVTQIFPKTSLNADAKTSVVLYGSGFTSSSFVYFDQSFAVSTRPLYTSPDGTVMVITIPERLPSGYHTVRVSNTYDLSATTTQSDPLEITVR